MAEESPRPESGEDSEEEEEGGEEATEAPVLKKKEAPESEDSTEEEAAATPEPSPPPPEEEEEEKEQASPSSTAPQPLLPTPPAFPLTMPAYYTPAAPASTTPTAPAFPSTTPGVNVFANDGSFMALFKKKMEQGPAGSKEEAATPEEKKPPEPEKRKPISFVGRRRGGAKLALKTGLVAKKPKTDEEEVVIQKGGAWAQYMAEVKKYKAHQCSDDDKTRPLVK